MNFAKWISFSFVVIFFYILWQIRQLLLLVLTSVILALSLNIFVGQLCKIGINRGKAVLISIITLLTLLLTFITLVVPSLLIQFQELTNLVPEGIDKLIIEINKIKDNLPSTLSNSLPDLEVLFTQLQPIINNLLTRGVSFVSGFLGTLLSSLLLLALTLMILAEPLSYRNGFIRLFPNFYRKRIDAILSLFETNLQSWLVDTFFRITSVIILISITLFFLGIRLVAAQSLLAGLLVLIPYLGPVISIISPLAIAFLSASWKAWLLIIIYFIIYQVIEHFIIIKLRKTKRIILVPFNIIFGEVFFTSFLGFLGLFLATPLTIISEILIKEMLIKDILDKWQLNQVEK